MAENPHAPYRGASNPVRTTDTHHGAAPHPDMNHKRAKRQSPAPAFVKEMTRYPTPRDEGFA
ncbi:hypothetical protein [Sulfitobacter sp. JB4-11]|uniref:hypothetical protein n=1 Tax=Sulfitobacter rhodophyticola TaxID=3238304 RepID=UPI003518D911